MFRRLLNLCIVLCCTLVFVAGCTNNYVSYTARHRIIITSNQTFSRMIADLAQTHTGITYILYEAPTSQGATGRIYPCLPTAEDVQALPVSELANCIYSFNPKQVIILGDDRYIPTSLENDINAKLANLDIMVTRYSNDNWDLQAKAIGKTLLCERIGYDFPALKKEYLARQAEAETQQRLK